MSLTAVVKEIVAATGYPAYDLLDGIKILASEVIDGGDVEDYPGIISFTRYERDLETGNRATSLNDGYIEQHARVCTVDLPEGVWERLELACLADDPSLKGRKLVGGVELRNFHAYFTPEGEDQQWISNETYSFR